MTIYDSIFDPDYNIEIIKEESAWPGKDNCYKVKLTHIVDEKRSFELSFVPKVQYNLAVKLRPLFNTVAPKKIKEIIKDLSDLAQESYNDGSNSVETD